MSNLLQQLRKLSSVVADTGDIDAIAKFQPEDATTNPSLILKAVQSGKFDNLIQTIIDDTSEYVEDNNSRIIEISDRLIVAMGKEILDHVPGKVSTEVDSRLSFNLQATVDKARKLISLYEVLGVGREKVLIKIAATWEGIQAASVLKEEGIECNLTLIFSFVQARACAEADVFLISPFVGRVLDWHMSNNPDVEIAPQNEPGVLQVKSIHNYFKQHNYRTVVMGASFRNIGEIINLAGCDKLTISPKLMEELGALKGDLLPQMRSDETILEIPKPLIESEFRWLMNEDALATEKLAEGIRGFTIDQIKLEALLSDYLK